MKLYYNFSLKSSETFELPVGIKKIKIRSATKATYILELGYISTVAINQCVDIEFPIINGKSPCKFTNTGSEDVVLHVLISEIGGIPDPNYFSDAPTVIPEIIPDEPTEQEEKKDAV